MATPTLSQTVCILISTFSYLTIPPLLFMCTEQYEEIKYLNVTNKFWESMSSCWQFFIYIYMKHFHMSQYFLAPCTRAIDYFVSQHVPCNWPVYGMQIEGMVIYWLWFRPTKGCCSSGWCRHQTQGRRTKRIVYEQPLHCSFSGSRNIYALFLTVMYLCIVMVTQLKQHPNKYSVQRIKVVAKDNPVVLLTYFLYYNSLGLLKGRNINLRSIDAASIAH